MTIKKIDIEIVEVQTREPYLKFNSGYIYYDDESKSKKNILEDISYLEYEDYEIANDEWVETTISDMFDVETSCININRGILSVARVSVTLESRENMNEVLIIASVISYDENGDELENCQDMVGKEFFGEDDVENEISEYIAKKLKICEDIIEIDNEFTKTPWDE